MAIPYYRWFPGDYARDTRHLSLMQHGVYRLLIDLYMDQGGPFRNDLPYLYRWLHAESVEEKNSVEFILAEFFLLSSNQWHHKRCDTELEWRESKSEYAKTSANKRWHSDGNANAMRTHSVGNANQNQNQNQIKEKSKALSVSALPKPDLASQSREVLDYLNQLTGRKFRPVDETLKPIQARLKAGFSAARLKEIALLKHEQWGTDERMAEYLRPKTLYTATNCANYDGVLPNGVDDD